MGVDKRKPLLPAPTDSTFHDTARESTTATDLATDVSRRTDKSSYSIPEDGSPITISTRRRSRNRDRDRDRDEGRMSRSGHHSQTSLLIEYFEGGKKSGGVTSRPSVRVRVTPSSRKNKEQSERYSTGEGSSRKPSYTKRISLGTPTKTRDTNDPGIDDRSISSDGVDEMGTRRPPLEIEFVNRDSEISARYIQPTSDISSIPPDSMLDGTTSMADSRRRRSHSISGDELETVQDRDLLKTPSRRRSRSLSRERIAQKAAEKISGSSRDRTRSKHQHSEGSRSREYLESHHKRSSKHRERDMLSPESSLLSTSVASGHGKAADQYSFRSNTSRSSLTNPRLLETVEDAIRRLILPELKELKKDRKVDINKSKLDRSIHTSSAQHKPRDEPSRRLSKHASAPDVAKRSSHSELTKSPRHTPDSVRSKERRKEKRASPRHERASSRRSSKDNLAESPSIGRKRSKGLRDAEAAKLVGAALTTAALKHHDSQSSFNNRERRSLKSKSSLTSSAVNETELIFQKHDVALMPLRSEIDSELTRDSILSHQSANTATVLHRDYRESPQNAPSPSQRDSSYLHHDVESDGNRTPKEARREYTEALSPHQRHLNIEFSHNRALSPIQSVASYQDTASDREHPEEAQNRGSIPSDDKYMAEKGGQMSIASLSSAASTDLARSTRTADYSNEKRAMTSSHIDITGAEFGYGETPMTPGDEQGDRGLVYTGEVYSDAEHDIDADPKHVTYYTNESYIDSVEHGQEIAKGVAANAEYIETPLGVESAVASLLEPSLLDAPSHQSRSQLNGSRSYSPDHHGFTEADPRDSLEYPQGSPDEHSFPKRMGVNSPPQSVANSDDQDKPIMRATGLPTAGSPMPEIDHVLESEGSEINTNPSIIQGPIGGVPRENRDHWPYEPTPPMSKGQLMSPDDVFDTTHDAQDFIETPGMGAGLGVIAEEHVDHKQPYYPTDHTGGYGADDPLAVDPYTGNHYGLASPLVKDEGYMSGANHRSTSSATPEPKSKGYPFNNETSGLGSTQGADDIFQDKQHNRHLSGFSHGMPSPLYDSATGKGIDRIQSKDIVALMDHLTVRDAQRNARDTEILVTLVRSAAEMRNSFEDMKKYIAQQDEMLVQTNSKQHDQTQKAIGGPRAIPLNTPRALSKQSGDFEEEIRSKKQNVFKRALKNLSLKSGNDLTNIEEMLIQLLSEVEALRAVQEGRVPNGNSADNVNYQGDYDDQNGSPQANRSGYTTNSPRRMNDTRMHSSQQGSDHRISPVQEVDEDSEPLTSHEQDLLDNQVSTESRFMSRHRRGGSVPLATPERPALVSGAVSTDTTPKAPTEKSRKHKSSSSSFFPKLSRWSRTTASSMGENFRNSIQPNRKDRLSSELSRSGSDLDQANYAAADYYDPRGDDRLRSSTSLNNERQENRPSSPLIPSQLSENPKYRAHRNSLNLQHPQPRQGPTSRYQTQLESQAHNYAVQVSPKSEPWASNPTLVPLNATHHRDTGRQSPISDGGYSATSSVAGGQNAAQRSANILDDGPLVPQRTPKPSDDPNLNFADRMAMRDGSRMNGHDDTNVSPARTAVPQRKPTGPRPITSSGRYGSGTANFPKTNRYQGSPNQLDDDDEY
ncbi:hypothetical protein FQN57_002295 [Myotisia sp. PD_48]|nr:hypothetical protein FQN57_002295 [Myotisia sp. PD_48]